MSVVFVFFQLIDVVSCKCDIRLDGFVVLGGVTTSEIVHSESQNYTFWLMFEACRGWHDKAQSVESSPESSLIGISAHDCRTEFCGELRKEERAKPGP